MNTQEIAKLLQPDAFLKLDAAPEGIEGELLAVTVHSGHGAGASSEVTLCRVFTQDDLKALDAALREAWPAKKWECDAEDAPGPRQVSAVEKALRACSRGEGFVQTVDGVVGQSAEIKDHGCTLNLFGFNPAHPAVRLALWTIGNAHGWTVSRSNANEIKKALQAAAEALKGLQPWLLDGRRTPEEEEKRQEGARLAAERSKEAAKARETGQEAMRELLKKRPPGAKALIVAELHENQSDPMTDYFAHRVTRTVAIGWRTGAREDFRQLRRAAAGFPETAHLGPGKDDWRLWAYTEGRPEDGEGRHGIAWRPEGSTAAKDILGSSRYPETREEAEAVAGEEVARAAMECHGTGDGASQWGMFARAHGWNAASDPVEHRENYSMGAGNYLKRGGSHSSGWAVKSLPLPEPGDDGLPWWSGSSIEDALPEPGSDDGAGGQETAQGEPCGDYTMQEARNKRGAFFLCVPAQRLERSAFQAERQRASDSGGWYSRKWGSQPGGFGFSTQEDAAAFAAGAVSAAQGAA